MGIQREEFSFSSPVDGVTLHGTYLYPENPKGVVQFVHGMAEHRGRYEGIMTFLAQQGYATVIHDHRGHGICEHTGYFGKGGKEGLVLDTYAVSQQAKEKFSGLPLWLFGHSMGSLVARCYLRRFDRELAGLFLCGTPYAPPLAIKAARVLIAAKIPLQGGYHRSHMVNGLVTGSFNKRIKDPASPNQWISYNQANVEAYDADPLCGFCFTLNGFEGLMEAMDEAYSQKDWAGQNPLLPIYVISGQDDPCHGGEKNFCITVEHLKKRGYAPGSKLFAGMRHEILREEECQQVYDYILKKLEEHQ